MITITGASGFIGRHLQKLLPDAKLIDKKLNSDICDMTIRDVGDVVIHLAAVSSIQQSFNDVEETMRTNLTGLAHVIKLCQEQNAKLVFVSSCSISKPLSPYSYSKLWGEQLVIDSGLEYIILRLGNVYGEGDDKSALYHFNRDKVITIYGDGSNVRSFIHVEDVVKSIKYGIDKLITGFPRPDARRIALVGGEDLTILEVAKMFKKPIKFEDARPGDADDLSMGMDYHYPDRLKTKLEVWINK
jgi:nucleoside-diphosphate-sugar epimerase